ncbi:hypothetical protein KY330_00580 [Candidatus Woesearchaeota archaeon]|nr:hypothetical protein [Candidatus Woesearchaeota archaeon]
MNCKNCGKDSGKYELCLDCYKLSKKKDKNEITDNYIKGRIAEAIIEEMFISLDYRVFRFGMENTVPGFGSRILPKEGPVANEVRKMPDFIVVKGSKIAYVEVKYRTSGEFDFNKHYKRKGRYPYSNAYFILVTPKHIKIQKASELEKGKKFMYLNRCKDFETDKETIIQYCKFCEKFFGNC